MNALQVAFTFTLSAVHFTVAVFTANRAIMSTCVIADETGRRAWMIKDHSCLAYQSLKTDDSVVSLYECITNPACESLLLFLQRFGRLKRRSPDSVCQSDVVALELIAHSKVSNLPNKAIRIRRITKCTVAKSDISIDASQIIFLLHMHINNQ